jgi:hypothetical protein
VHCPLQCRPNVLQSGIGVVPCRNDVESPLTNAIKFTKSGVILDTTRATQVIGMLFQAHVMDLGVDEVIEASARETFSS